MRMAPTMYNDCESRMHVRFDALTVLCICHVLIVFLLFITLTIHGMCWIIRYLPSQFSQHLGKKWNENLDNTCFLRWMSIKWKISEQFLMDFTSVSFKHCFPNLRSYVYIFEPSDDFVYVCILFIIQSITDHTSSVLNHKLRTYTII